MNQIDILRQTRQNILDAVEGLSNRQLNTIPQGFNNSIAWNIGHVVVTQQLLVYRLSNSPLYISDEMVDKFRKGSNAGIVSEEEMVELKRLLLELVAKFEQDSSEGVFGRFNDYPTSYGLTLKTVEDAVKFNSVHEALHLGYIMAQKRALLH